MDRRRFDNALAQANVALEYDPDNAPARLLKAQVLIVRQDYAAAVRELDQYLGDENSGRVEVRDLEVNEDQGNAADDANEGR